ncbi:Glu/Leu/Phe/Val dehydrogenase [Haematospirillum jordaniae]|uniref:Amino acid dehydrogenase n=1 Tax=Haematospirillum jordaniae TaxID=1549855 RepID=A0A143DFN8_9PROT|nr:Glu/Leu/Phe/Val dehydrogenase dimerization domain-containing protein [Haematospirillum jordaniae]AMW35551.1 amino acid dehydrogenase [Haematospirillum jordaniae]NKD46121.1 Glu/Leu/Phe/Val dehydrogenase [Haematospirillum jordaniae]NKD57073.1 Glu/Leu/Phe/Val dehydrogenase [Haematospirillum jordaniae]NKD58771.1 Glu/Leu/Phe/Val dehydrogenase [Haematospirillum jordaniae]NKD66998.1 Glu/Leu/Phe/Val dehydrogenase [Haematospirillum jordaniae]
MNIVELRDFDDHELVVLATDTDSGLKAVIAVHSTIPGPACGGTRMWPYASHQEAIIDVLRLSRGMTYKNIMAGLPLGGGKSVIIGDPTRHKSEALLRAFGRKVEALGGRYIAAEDVGTSPADMDIIATETRHVAGTGRKNGLGDPSPFTAWGVFHGIRATATELFGTPDLQGRTIAVQGLGHVGHYVCSHLATAGAKLIVSDIDPTRIDYIVREYGAVAIDPDRIHAVECDIFAPCALGASLNPVTIPDIKAKAVAGAANNQLATPDMAMELQKRSILYAPDYVINAGGVMAIASDIDGTFTTEGLRKKAAAIAETLSGIYQRARLGGQTTADVADTIARERLYEIKANRQRSVAA